MTDNRPMIHPLDLVSTPVPVLDGAGLRTTVGLSAADPLALRNRAERFRVLVTFYDGDGGLLVRREIEPLAAGTRRMIDLDALAADWGVGAGNRLAVVHRVPQSLCPPGSDIEAATTGDTSHEAFDMYRAVVQYAYAGGGNGSVVYETPPLFNDDRARPSPAETLSFTSKILIGSGLDTVLCPIYYSVNPAYRRTARYRFMMMDSDGATVAEREFALAPFTAEPVSLSGVLGDAGIEIGNKPGNFSLVAWSMDAAIIPLILQTAPARRSVSVEHVHPAQAFLMPSEPAARNRIKAAAIRQWDKRFGTGGPARTP